MLEAVDLTCGKISRQLKNLAVPIMGTSFLEMAHSFTDMAWLGRLGAKSVAAVGVVSVFLWIANSMALLCKTASEVTISQSLGSKNIQMTKIISGNNTTISVILGSFVALLFYVLMNKLLGIYSLAEDVYVLSEKYFSITNIGIPFIFISLTFFGIYNASGNSKVPFKLFGIGLIMNILLDPVFIFLFDWGVEGAALATILSQIFIAVAFIFRLKYFDKLFGGFDIISRLHKKIVIRVFKIGAPVAFLNMFFAFITMFLGRFASLYGGHIAVATLTTGGQIEALTWNTSQGATTALCTFVGQNFGARKINRIIKSFRLATLFTFSVGLLGTVLFIFLGYEIFSLIVPDRETAMSGANYLMISGYSQIFMMAEITSQGLLYGLSRSYAPAIVSLCGNILRIPLALFLIVDLSLGVSGIWWAISISSIIKGIVLYSYARYIMSNKI